MIAHMLVEMLQAPEARVVERYHDGHAALIVQGYRPEGMHAIEWMAICEEYRYFAMIGTHCLCELAKRHKAKQAEQE
jgi:hypothetical protein